MFLYIQNINGKLQICRKFQDCGKSQKIMSFTTSGKFQSMVQLQKELQVM